MRDQPDGINLLTTAEQIIRQQILADVPAQHQYQMLMCLRAMGIAQRQLRYGDAPQQAELERMAAFVPVLSSGDLTSRLADANRALSHSIRDGLGNPGSTHREALIQHLRETTRQRVLESNPKYLA